MIYSWEQIDKELEGYEGVGMRWLIEALRYEGFNTDAFSKCQLMSKKRLVTFLSIMRSVKEVVICGSWYGQLATMLHNKGVGTGYTGIDIDPTIAEMATHLNRYIPFDHKIADMYEYNYTGADLVINTSCEHIDNLRDWLDLLPSGTTVALQSNDYLEGEGHISCVNSLDEFKAQAQLPIILYDDVLEMPMYTRYTLIGRV